MNTKNRPGSAHPAAPPTAALLPSRKVPINNPVGATRVTLGARKPS